MRNAFAKLSKYNKNKLLALIASVLLWNNQCVYAQNSNEQEWWFTVELIAFERDLSPSNSEDFSEADFTFSNEDALDIFSLLLVQELSSLNHYILNLPACQLSEEPQINQLIPLPILDLNLEPPEPKLLPLSAYVDKLANIELNQFQLLCVSNTELTALNALKNPITQVPLEIFAKQPYFVERPHLIDVSSLSLNDYANKIFKQRDISPLLYTAWRQQVVFGKDKANFLQIRAGELLDPNVKEIIESPIYLAEQALLNEQQGSNDDFFAKLNNDLEQLPSIDWLALSNTQSTDEEVSQALEKKWGLEGIFKVYLEYVNQVPYLHVESELKHHRLSLDSEGNPKLDVYPFNQRRRIISKQIHYFDHPAFGLIIRLERFEKPLPEVSLEELLEP